MKRKLNLSSLACLLLFSCGVWSQIRTITEPVLDENRACASLNSPTIDLVTAELSPGDALPNNNEFILQLSDTTGSFANPETILELARIDGPNNGTASTQDLEFTNFLIPIDLEGSDDYRLRIISSTNSDIVSDLSIAYPFFYFENDTQFILNNFDDVIVCGSNTIDTTIEIFERLGVGNNIPIDPGLYNWNWFKDGQLLLGEKESSLRITSEGRYQAQVDLGGMGCNNAYNLLSTNILTAEIIQVENISIETTAPDFSYCPDEEKRLSASVIDFTWQYQWLKDGVPIEGAVFSVYDLPDNDFGGEYSLEVRVSDLCEFPVDPVTVINEGSSITSPLPEFLLLIPTVPPTLEITTDAPIGSSYEWLVDTAPLEVGELMSDTETFDGTVIVANYRIEIDANDDCNTQLFSETDVLTPTGFEMVIGTDEEVNCDEETIPLQLLSFSGRTSRGLVPLTEEQLGAFEFQWLRDGQPVGNTNGDLEVLEVSRSDVGGVYQLIAAPKFTLPGADDDVPSNEVPILFLADVVLQVDPLILTDSEPVVLTAPFDDTYTYEWFEVVGGENVSIPNETSNTLEVTEEGDYFVRITTPLCPADSSIVEVRREIGVAEIIPNIVTPNGDGINDNWLLPQEYINNPEVEVTIYNIRGIVDASTKSYQNNWPAQLSNSQGEDPIYYFIITKNSQVVRKGSITVMK